MAICIRSSWFFHKSNSWCIDTFMGFVSPSKVVGRQFSFSTDMLVLWVPSVTKSWSVKNFDAKEAPDNYEVIWHLLDGFAFQRRDFQILMWSPLLDANSKLRLHCFFGFLSKLYFSVLCFFGKTLLYCRVLTLDDNWTRGIFSRHESFDDWSLISFCS